MERLARARNRALRHNHAEDGASGPFLFPRGARFSLPGIDRFLTPDPIGHEGGPTLCAHCANDPVNQIDPDGTQGTTGS